MSTSPITTHVLDTALGRPAQGLHVELHHGQAVLGHGVTDANGRVADLLTGGPISPGTYQLIFDTAGYAQSIGGETFYPQIIVTFTIESPDDHFHVPLLLSPFGYTTYRGSR